MSGARHPSNPVEQAASRATWIGRAVAAGCLALVLAVITVAERGYWTSPGYVAEAGATLFGGAVVFVAATYAQRAHVAVIRAYLFEVERLNEELHRLASRDRLTGLLNRASFWDTIEWYLANDPEGECCVAIFDLDGFKALNDTRGHVAGDQALVAVARHLSESGCVAAGRIGGDEFAVLLDFDGHQARLMCSDLTAGVEKYGLGLSVGVANYPGDGRDAQQLMAVADRRMYEDKRHRKLAA